MKKYIGTKTINAKEMNRQEYNDFRGWDLPENEQGEDEGYLVESTDTGTPNTTEFVGYVSWSPTQQFVDTYKQSGNLNFGDALVYLKQGIMVARKGWNGKGMYLVYMAGYPDGVPANKETAIKHGIELGSVVVIDPYITMYTANGSIVPWMSSQTDMLSDDWCIV